MYKLVIGILHIFAKHKICKQNCLLEPRYKTMSIWADTVTATTLVTYNLGVLLK